MVALEARQIAWLHAAPASKPGEIPPAEFQAGPVLRAAVDLAMQVAERAQAVEQIDVFTEATETCVRAFMLDGSEATVYFETPRDFRARDLRRALEDAFGAG
jgi:hypothetical protein